MPPTTKKAGADDAAETTGKTTTEDAQATTPATPDAPATEPTADELKAALAAALAQNEALKAQAAAAAAEKADQPDHSRKVRLRYNGPEGKYTLHVTSTPITLDPFGYFPAHRRVVRALILEKMKYPDPSHPGHPLNGKPKFTIVDADGKQVDPAEFLDPGDIFIPFGY